ncbi:hypothetical protein BDL97_14G107000 [Sphagnum fallax]|nr:hypothetical protein BDL97_14G107000 [Sphagnum fallax]
MMGSVEICLRSVETHEDLRRHDACRRSVDITLQIARIVILYCTTRLLFLDLSDYSLRSSLARVACESTVHNITHLKLVGVGETSAAGMHRKDMIDLVPLSNVEKQSVIMENKRGECSCVRERIVLLLSRAATIVTEAAAAARTMAEPASFPPLESGVAIAEDENLNASSQQQQGSDSSQQQEASDSISQAFVSREILTALLASAAADDSRNSTMNTAAASFNHQPMGAPDAHTLQSSLPLLRTKRLAAGSEDVEDQSHEWNESSPPNSVQELLQVESSPQITATPAGPASSSGSNFSGDHRPQPEISSPPPPLQSKVRKPNLQALILPQELQADNGLEPSLQHGKYQNNSHENTPIQTDSPGRMYHVMNTTCRKPPRPLTARPKTRLQDPPPLTPAVTEHVSRRRYSSIVGLGITPEQESAALFTTRGVLTRRRSMPAAGGPPESLPHSFAAATPIGKIKMIATKFFTPRGPAAAAPTSHPPIPEEEASIILQYPFLNFCKVDPLGDETIPQYKIWKETSNACVQWTQWISLMVVCVLLICSVRLQSLRKVYWYNLVLWEWLTLALVVACGRLISGFAVKLLVILIEHHYLLRKRVLYFVYGLRHAVKNFFWLSLVIATWKIIFRNNTDQETVPVITKVLWCCFTASVLWMTKVLFVKVAANSFHRAAYFDRIQDSLFHQYVLETLSHPKIGEGDDIFTWPYDLDSEQDTRPLANVTEPEQGHTNSQQSSKSSPGLRGREQPTKPVTSDVELQEERREHEHSISVSNSLRSSPPSDPAGSPGGHKKVNFNELPASNNDTTSPAEVIIAQDKLQELTSDPGKTSLSLQNFVEMLPEDKAMKAFALFEVSDEGTISKKALVKWVVNVYKERKALSLTLSDNRTVVAKLHRVLDVLMLAILLTICLLIMGVNTQKLLVAFSSILLPSVFVFGNAARSTFESLIFLFIVHPFDVGDRILVDGVSLLVEEMNILNTILLSGSNEKVYYPNSILASKPISNYNRSPDQWDAIDFQIHATTPVEKIGILKEQMGKYMESLPQFWYPTFRLLCKDIEDSNRMKMSLWMQHHLNFQVQLLNTQPHNSNLLCNNLYNKGSGVCVSESFIPTYKPTLPSLTNLLCPSQPH